MSASMEATERALFHGHLAELMQRRGHRGWAVFHERQQIRFERVVEDSVLSLPCITRVVDEALAGRREVR